LFRVFANLLDNGNQIHPGQRQRSNHREREGGKIKIGFTDNGVGIAPEDQPRVWERLFRASRSRTERGLGLGLSFVRAIIRPTEAKLAWKAAQDPEQR
jgi:signal transduction histidine kinase